MTREDYKRAGDLFDQIRDLPVSDRSAALAAASDGNHELRAQVVRLLEADRRAADAPFLNRPVMEDAAQIISAEPSGLPLPGTLIGSYRLGARIGAGGMGVVYQAEDLRLHRRVAVKILPLQSGAQAEEGIQRFQREARAAGQLNHPHIAAIYDAGFDDGCYYIAMELVEGRTLRALIAADSRFIEAKFVLDVISQIASALSAAHQAGIVHRDIKPENIMVRPDNFVKVLDFGLARMHEPSGIDGDTDLRTRPGHLAGTVQYLSPEQVLGKPAGPLSDLFSLGVVAYEFATGVRPFDGPTDGAVYEAILHRDPALPSAVRPALGNELDGMILQALEKDPDLRFQTAGDLRSTCRRLSRSSNPNVTPNALAAPVISGRRKSPLTIGAVAVLGAVTLAGLLWYFAPSRRSGTIALPNHFQQLTDDPGEENFPSFSPDGKQFAYASARNNKWDIYLQRIGGSKFVDLTSDSSGGNTQPAFSPDGSHIAFRSERDGGGIFVMEATGENPRRVAPLGYLPAWAPDNRRVAYCTHTFTTPKQVTQPPSDLYVVDLDKGSQRKLPSGDAQQPNWSPHGFRIAYWSVSAGGQRDIFTIDASGNGAPVPVTSDAAVDWNPVWSPSGGQLWFISDRGGTMNIWRVPIDERTGRTLGPPEPSTVPARFVGNLALSQDGKTIIFSEASQRYNLSRVGFDPERRVTTRTEALAAGHVVANFSFAPDGSRMVYDTLGDVSENLWIMNADGSGQRRLTSDVYRNRSPEWSPSGDEILFYSDRGGRYEDWLIGPDGSGLHAITRGSNPEMQGGLWSPDGKEILACRFGKTGMLNPRSAKPAAGPTPAPGLSNVSDLYCEEWTSGPDGDQALCHIITGKGENLIYSASEGKLEPTGTLGGHGASWVPPASPNDAPHRAFVFGRGSDCFLYDRVSRRQTLLFSVAPNQLHSVVVGRDGRHIYFSERVRDSDLWLGRLGE